jgi:hypothetical protein
MVIGVANKPFDFVPVWFYKSWESYLITPQNERIYKGKEPFSPKNAARKWEEPVEGGILKHILNLNVFMILEKDLSSPMPQLYLFRFRGKSTNEGKKLITFWTNAKNYGQEPYSYVFSITPTLVTDQKGKYYIANLSNAMTDGKYRQISGEPLNTVKGWIEMIKRNIDAMTNAQLAVEVEDDEISAPIPVAPTAASVTQGELSY